MLKKKIRAHLGRGNKAIVVSVRELAIRMYGLRCTEKQISSIDSCLRDMTEHGELERVQRYSHLAGRVVNKFFLKGEHPRW